MALTSESKAVSSRLEEARAQAHRMEQTAKRANEDRDSFQSSLDLKQHELDRLNGLFLLKFLLED